MSHPLVPPYMLSTNQVLNQGRYRVINQFGNIESESLYEAYDTVSETKVVLRETVGQLGKVATAAQIENLKATFAADAKRLTEVEHPALLKVRDYFSEIDRQYLVIEACDGNDLVELVEKSDKNLALADVLRWADQILDGLGYLHSKHPPIVHKKVCPQNIRLASNFTVKLLVTGSDGTDSADGGNDAGEASDQPYRALEQLWLGLDSASQKMIANSFGERSEEILRQPADARTDVYSAGATLYYLLTRTVPANALDRYLEILDGNDDPLQRPSELDASIPVEVSDALIRAMDLKREYRFDSAAAMRTELAKVNVPANSRLAETKKPSAEVSPVADTQKEDEERLLFEKERAELEAEHKRLDEERAKIEKRKLELEAERKRQATLLEANRREEERKKAEKLKADQAAEKAAADKKAADEQKAAEERKAAAEKKAVEDKAAAERAVAEKAAAEKKAAEEERVAAEQKAAKELAAKKEREDYLKLKAEAEEKARLALAEKHEVEKLQKELAKDDLLDLPEHISEPSNLPGAVSDVLALEVERPTAKAAAASMSDFDMFSEGESPRSFIGRPVVLAGAGLLALVVVVGVWMLSGRTSTATPSPAASIQNVTTPTEPQPTDAQPDSSVPAETASTSDQSAVDASNSQALTAEQKARNEQLAKQKQKQLEAQKAKPTPEKKKAVTVDDLINDN